MKLSTRGRYASRAVLDIALENNDGPVSLHAVAKRQNISERYLENIMRILASRGLVTSVRGKHGGFRLAKSPKEILLGDIVQAVEGSLSPVECLDAPSKCDRSLTCVTHDVWDKLKKSILDILNSISLQDLIDMHKKKTTSNEQLMYYI